MPVLTELQIVQMAVAEVGSSIEKISDKSDINLQQLSDLARDATLGMHDWKFARKRARVSAAGILDASAKTITFADANPDTIADNGSGFITSGAEDDDIVKISNSSSNNNRYKINTVAAGLLTLQTFEEVTAEVLTNDADLKLYFSPASKWDYKYAKPDGFLRLLSINEYKSNEDRWDLEGNFIVTNDIDLNDQITIRYIKSITDESVWTDLFTQVFMWTLASMLVRPLEKDIKNEVALNLKARQVLLDGLASMAGETPLSDEREDTGWQKAGR